MTLNSLPESHLRRLIDLALEEDGAFQDVTSACLVPEAAFAEAELISRAEGIIAGLFLLQPSSPLRQAFPTIEAELHCSEGAEIVSGQQLATLRGSARQILALERPLLNFLQRLSGIATETRRFVEAAHGTRARIQETRKTCPGWRHLDKYAVALGGGLNHRMGLHDQILVKENHLRFWPGLTPAQAVARAVREARSRMPPGMVLEIEVEDLAQFEAALAERPDVIMLDDFSDAETSAAVALRNAGGSTPLLEVSGGVRLERVAALAALGVDRISVGALTHSVRALDLALKIVTFPERSAAP